MEKNLLRGGLCLSMAVASLTMTSLPAFADDAKPDAKFQYLDEGVASSITADGRLVGGFDSWSNPFEGFIAEPANGNYKWTTDDGAYLHVLGVNKNGVAVGVMESDVSIHPSDGETSDEMVNILSAAIWKDGEITELPWGPGYTAESFNFGNDGFYAKDISEDGTIITGSVIRNMMCYGCMWTLVDGEYVFEDMPFPSEFKNNNITFNNFEPAYPSVSGDGKVIVSSGIMVGASSRPYFIIDGKPVAYVSRTWTNYYYYGDAVSDNGKYALCTACVDGTFKMYVFEINVAEKSVKVLWNGTLTDYQYDGDGCRGYAIDNNACGYVSVDQRLYYFNAKTQTLVPISDFLSNFDIKGGKPGSSDDVVGISADGTKVLGSDGSRSWLLTLPEVEKMPVIVNNVHNVQVFFTGPGTAAAKWNELDVVPEDCTLKGYKVVANGKEDFVAAPATRYDFEAKEGYALIQVVAVVTRDGEEFESGVTDGMFSLPQRSDLYFYENYDAEPDIAWSSDDRSVTYAGDNWVSYSISEGQLREWEATVVDYLNNSPTMSTQCNSYSPYESILLSRFLDATEADPNEMRFTYSLLRQSTNLAAELPTEVLELQWSENGEDWTTLRHYNMENLSKRKWHYDDIDLSDLAGKVFQLRWIATGNGDSSMQWSLDYMGLYFDQVEAPAKIRAYRYEGEDEVKIEWSNTIASYDVSHLANYPKVAEAQIGSQGKPLMIASDFSAEMMAPYVGMDINRISAIIYDNPFYEQPESTDVTAIVYAKGYGKKEYKEIWRGKVEGPFDFMQERFGAKGVDVKDLKVEANKDYRVAIRIADYDPKTAPIWYQNDPAYIPGVTDLYSEDEGKTWNLFSEVYDDEEMFDMYGMAIWPIRLSISDEAPAGEWDNVLWAYNLYRDGEIVNTNEAIWFPHPNFSELAVEGAKYQVQAFYEDGRISKLSEPVTVEVVKKPEFKEDPDDPDDPNPDNPDGVDEVINASSFDVYSTTGISLMRSATAADVKALPAGLYIINGKKVIVK